MFRFVLFVLCFTTVLPVFGQNEEMHLFTDKSGKQVLASLLSISSDNRNMKIRREDGQEFELVINVLSLDDQQYIKERLGEVPVEKTEFRIEMEIDRKLVSSDNFPFRDGDNDYTLTEEVLSYVISIQNLSRESVENATLEWIIALDDRMEIVEDDVADQWTYDRKAGNNEENLSVVQGVISVPLLPFNQETEFLTDEVKLSRLLFNRDPYEEDVLKGVIARLVGGDGEVVAETRLGGGEIDEMKWDDAIALLAPEE